MSIVILTGGASAQGNPEHRYLVDAFLKRFGQQVTRIITAEPVTRSLNDRLLRTLKRGNYKERLARYRYPGGYGPSIQDLQKRLRPHETEPTMPGDSRRSHVQSHNNSECKTILEQEKPSVIVVYGTRIIERHIFECASSITLNMHTGLSPYYRGDSTLFWPIYYNEPDKLGVTVHELVESVDGGAIAATAPVHYDVRDTEADLFAKGVKAGTAIYLDCVEAALKNSLKLTPQDLSAGREFKWVDRTVASEQIVLSRLDNWAKKSA
ncbi:MAG: formyl transferase [Granulosicoccus sp.]